MNCREFERGIEALLGDPSNRSAQRERELLEHHAAGCTSCAELLELARLPLADPGALAAGVLERTSGAACPQAEERLPDLVDGLLPAGAERELLFGHLAHCTACSGVRAELERLSADLPRLAVVQPETSLLEEVLRRTLPAPVRLRRWWAANWPRWVRRPRFAAELAYVATLVLVVVFGTPVSPLQAMPRRAAQLVKEAPLDRFEAMPQRAGETVATGWKLLADEGTERARSVVGGTRATVGTIVDEVASWFVSAGDEHPADTDQTIEETS